jgi:hypothetical protein
MAQLFGTTVEDWESITIAGYLFAQTKVTVDGLPSIKLESANAPGTDGARQTYQGYLPSPLTISVLLWTDDLVKQWKSMIATVRVKPSKTAPAPVVISYPTLAWYGLSKFEIVKTPLPKFVGPQQLEGRLELVEYFPKPKASGKQKPKLSDQPTIFDDTPPPKPAPPDTSNTDP